MKPFSVLFLWAVLGLSGCQDQRVSEHEKRLTDLESKVRTLEEKQRLDADAATQKESDFKNCVDAANNAYMQSIRINGTANRNGSIAVDTRVMPEIERQKQSKLEECKLLYK